MLNSKNTTTSFGWRSFSLGKKFASLQILLSVVLLGVFFDNFSFYYE